MGSEHTLLGLSGRSPLPRLAAPRLKQLEFYMVNAAVEPLKVRVWI
jgi:hypothetical protein